MSGAVSSYASWQVFHGHISVPVFRTDEKIRSFGRMPVGWHYGKGVPARGDIIRVAREYLWHFLMMGYQETDAFPGVDGEIMVTAYRGDYCTEITIEADGTYSVGYQFKGKDRFFESDLSRENANLLVMSIVTQIEQEEREAWGTSSWSILNTMTLANGSFAISYSNPPAMEAAHPLWTSNAEHRVAEQYVPT